MQLKVIQNVEEFKSLAEAWNDLLACCSASHVPFLRHEYLETWWETLGGGEWNSGELFIIIWQQDNGELRGIAPLFFTHNREGIPSLMLIGSIEISDYLDLIVRPGDLPEFVESILQLAETQSQLPWQCVDWYNIPEESPTLPALQAAAERRGWVYRQERLQPCPFIPLPGDWETYLASLDKKQRHEIRRKMRRAEENTPPVRWYIVEDASRLDEEIDDFLSLMIQDPDKERFLTQVMRTQLSRSVHVAFQAGWLQLAFLEVGGVKAASYLNFNYAGHIWVYNSGLNYALRELSPGWVLLGYLLKWANDHKRLAFDFMRGGEEYKYRFGGLNRYVARAVLERPTP